MLEEDETAVAEMIVPPEWKFVAGGGVKITGGFDDVVELHLDMNSHATKYGLLVGDRLKLPIAIEPPVMAWRLSGPGTHYQRFGGTTEDIWLADIDSGTYETIDIMTTARTSPASGWRLGMPTEIISVLLETKELSNSSLASLLRRYVRSLLSPTYMR